MDSHSLQNTELPSEYIEALLTKEYSIVGRTIRWRSFLPYFKQDFENAYRNKGYDTKLKGTYSYYLAFRSYLGSCALIVMNTKNGISSKDSDIDFWANDFEKKFTVSPHWRAFTKSKVMLFNTADIAGQIKSSNRRQRKIIAHIASVFVEDIERPSVRERSKEFREMKLITS